MDEELMLSDENFISDEGWPEEIDDAVEYVNLYPPYSDWIGFNPECPEDFTIEF